MASPALRARARADIAEAVAWYEGERRGLGREFARSVRASLAAIGRNPLHYQRAHHDVRRVLVRRFPYALYFVAEREQVVVIACVHVRREPQLWQSRR